MVPGGITFDVYTWDIVFVPNQSCLLHKWLYNVSQLVLFMRRITGKRELLTVFSEKAD